jgi:hypothetical protein
MLLSVKAGERKGDEGGERVEREGGREVNRI